jgi:hypothetical protein
MFSIYTCAFNIVKNNFPYSDALENFSSFADEVVVAVNTSEDDTLGVMKGQASKLPNVKIIETDYSYDDIFAIGKIKNDALQATTKHFKIGLDLDERIPLRHKYQWEKFATIIEDNDAVDALLIPSLNLWGNLGSVRDDFSMHERKFKWYLHTAALERGAVNFGVKEDGTVDTKKSDTCELIYPDRTLVRAGAIWEDSIKNLDDYFFFLENKASFVYHIGYADLEYRSQINKNWWREFKQKREGDLVNEPHDIKTDRKDLEEPITEHKLPAWNEQSQS